jgi:hypothetical protein
MYFPSLGMAALVSLLGSALLPIAYGNHIFLGYRCIDAVSYLSCPGHLVCCGWIDTVTNSQQAEMRSVTKKGWAKAYWKLPEVWLNEERDDKCKGDIEFLPGRFT